MGHQLVTPGGDAPVVVHAATTVVPIVGDPIADGAIAVHEDRIVAVGCRADVNAEHPAAELVEWDGVMVAGLVNAHTHLQYTSFEEVGAHRYDTYVDWARRFVAEYDRRRAEDWRAIAIDGVDRAVRAGTTCLGDVVTDAAAMDVLVACEVPGVAYAEVIGTDLDDWHDGVAASIEHLLTTTPTSSASRVGLSPHAPYSVAPQVIRASVELARRLGVRIHSHVGEIDTEEQMYREGTGPWAERVRSVHEGPWPLLDEGGSGLGTADFAASCGLIGPDVHLAHGVHLDAAGRLRFAAAGTMVALCPRSNEVVGAGSPPVAAYLADGVPFCVGTDSLGSNRTLDLLDDLAVLRQLAEAGGAASAGLDRLLLAAATIQGARALGLDGELGALTAGRRADFAVFDVEPDPRAVETALVRYGAGRCVATVIGGARRG